MLTSDGSLRDIHSFSLNGLPYTKIVQDSRHVRGELDAGTNEAKIVRVFIYINILETTLSQSKSSGQATHSRAQDGDSQILG
jgi:hypothetical protein